MNITSNQLFNAATTVLPLLSGVLVGQTLDNAFNNQGGISLGTATNLAFGMFAGSFASLIGYDESPSIENTVIKIALFAVPILFLCLKRTQVAAIEKATVVEKPSIARATLAQVPAAESGEVKIRRAAMAVAKSVEQLSESLPVRCDEELKEQVRAVINGQGTAEEKDERILALVNAR